MLWVAGHADARRQASGLHRQMRIMQKVRLIRSRFQDDSQDLTCGHVACVIKSSYCTLFNIQAT